LQVVGNSKRWKLAIYDFKIPNKLTEVNVWNRWSGMRQ